MKKTSGFDKYDEDSSNRIISSSRKKIRGCVVEIKHGASGNTIYSIYRGTKLIGFCITRTDDPISNIISKIESSIEHFIHTDIEYRHVKFFN